MHRKAFSLLELLAVVVILGVIASLAIPRFSNCCSDSRRKTCYMNKGDLEVQVQIWRRNQGSFPAANLSDIGSDPSYFPAGLPTCPVDGSSYQIDSVTHTVVGHVH